jgi:hypothetical protein
LFGFEMRYRGSDQCLHSGSVPKSWPHNPTCLLSFIWLKYSQYGLVFIIYGLLKLADLVCEIHAASVLLHQWWNVQNYIYLVKTTSFVYKVPRLI